MLTSKQIIKAIGCKHLELVQGNGYWYFVYDDKAGKYESESVAVLRLSHADMAFWVAIGKDFVARMEV